MKRIVSIIIAAACLAAGVSCNDWLDISSKSEIVTDQQFSNEAGFRDALTGVYILLGKPALYGKNMTWCCVDFLAQQYAVVAGAADLTVPQYQYQASSLTNYGKTMWNAQYNVIANINNILKWADRNHGIMHPVQDSIVRGECLALRAFCHLDLMRLYGKGHLGARPQLAGEPTVPYVTEFSKATTPQRTYPETFRLLFSDIEQALAYLEADPIRVFNDRAEGYYDAVIHDGFIDTNSANRRIRMNYYACLALYARALMWEGSAASRAKALETVRKIIHPENIAYNTGWYAWITATRLSSDDYLQRDNAFLTEQLWTLYIDRFMEYQETTYGYSWFYAHSPNNMYNVVYLTQARAREVFEIDAGITSDWRYTKGLRAEGSSLNNFAILKIRDQDETLDGEGRLSEAYRCRMPMLRISEMFYIAAECLADSDPTEALGYLNTVRNKRNIPANMDLAGLTPDQVRDEIKKEYMKEFIAEGQLFFYYKRTGAEYIPGYTDPMTDAQYVFPLPDNELINGHRDQTPTE